jgi:hypothetical protein
MPLIAKVTGLLVIIAPVVLYNHQLIQCLILLLQEAVEVEVEVDPVVHAEAQAQADYYNQVPALLWDIHIPLS